MELSLDSLDVTRGKERLSIPIHRVKGIGLESGFSDNLLSITYADPSDGEEMQAVFRFPGVKGGSVTGQRIVERMRAAGVSETEFRHGAKETRADTSPPTGADWERAEQHEDLASWVRWLRPTASSRLLTLVLLVLGGLYLLGACDAFLVETFGRGNLYECTYFELTGKVIECGGPLGRNAGQPVGP